MAWTSSTISTTDSIARHEYKINTYTSSGQNWTSIISVAHEKLGNDIITRNNNYYEDDLLDNITNTLSLRLALDYLSLALIFNNMANNGLYLQWNDKKVYYFHMYNALLSLALPRIKISGYKPYQPSGYFQL